ncbi:hypothetical protein BTS2_3446 [Bacillus sp. TS-2]|nr:hypothetical protein BTS2_3446 [Bacillus sp. TS-2]
MRKTGVIQLRLGEECMICEKKRIKGIHVLEAFLCDECERKMMTLNTDDLQYTYYLNQMKKIQSHSN